MASYNIVFKPSIEKDLRSLPKSVIVRGQDFQACDNAISCLPESDKDLSTCAESRLTPSIAVEEMIVLASKVSRCLESLR